MGEKVPLLVRGFDLSRLKLDPTDGFVLSRIDGRLAPKELARETGLSEFSVAQTLEKLERLGAITMGEPKATPTTAAVDEAARGATGALAAFESGLLPPRYAPSELTEPADLSLELKKRILDFYHWLSDLDHYALLSVPRDADRKEIKRSYYELAATFHPDRYFKKELGSFKAKMEAVFNRATEASDTLADRVKRAEYDAYLAEVGASRGMETLLEREMAKARFASSPPPRPTGPPPPPSPAEASELQWRKDALARRLTGGARPPPTQPNPPNPVRHATTADATDAFKRRYEERLASAKKAHIDKFVQAAEDALARNELASAATSYGLAAKFAPEDEKLAAKALEVRRKADHALVDSYLKQAENEEKQARWADAARNWSKVANVKNEAHAHYRAARAHLEAAEDMNLAAEHAKAAVALGPSEARHHVTLIEAYTQAGLAASARKAAEAAERLLPKDTELKDAIRKLGL